MSYPYNVLPWRISVTDSQFQGTGESLATLTYFVKDFYPNFQLPQARRANYRDESRIKHQGNSGTGGRGRKFF